MQAAPRAEDVDVKVAIASGVFLAVLGIALTMLCVWALSETHTEYRELLSQQAPLLVQDTGISAFYAGFPLMLGLLVLGLFMIWVGLRGQRYPDAVNRKVMRIACVLLIMGLIGLVAGRSIANGLWAENFATAGYTECSGAFSITKKWFTGVWAQDPHLCTEGEIRRMFSSPKYRLPDINAYIKAQREPGKS